MEKKISTVASMHTKHFSVHLDEVLLGKGKVSKRIRIDHPEATAVIPFISEDEIMMVRQYRYALGRETLEIPAGKVATYGQIAVLVGTGARQVGYAMAALPHDDVPWQRVINSQGKLLFPITPYLWRINKYISDDTASGWCSELLYICPGWPANHYCW